MAVALANSKWLSVLHKCMCCYYFYYYNYWW